MIPFPVTPAEELVLPTEDIEAFQELRAGLHAEHLAATPTELFLVEELVLDEGIEPVGALRSPRAIHLNDERSATRLECHSERVRCRADGDDRGRGLPTGCAKREQ